MTTLLAKAFESASTLPPSLQDELARELLEEVNFEKMWQKEFASGKTSVIDEMAKQALEEFNAGKTIEAHWDQL